MCACTYASCARARLQPLVRHACAAAARSAWPGVRRGGLRSGTGPAGRGVRASSRSRSRRRAAHRNGRCAPGTSSTPSARGRSGGADTPDTARPWRPRGPTPLGTLPLGHPRDRTARRRRRPDADEPRTDARRPPQRPDHLARSRTDRRQNRPRPPRAVPASTFPATTPRPAPVAAGAPASTDDRPADCGNPARHTTSTTDAGSTAGQPGSPARRPTARWPSDRPFAAGRTCRARPG